MTPRIYSTGEVARMLGLRRYQLSYLLETGRVEEPEQRVAGKRVWTASDVERAAAAIEEHRDTSLPGQRGRTRGCE